MSAGGRALGLLAVALPALAHACPACGRGDGGTWGTFAALGAMLLVPFVVGLGLWLLLRRADAAHDWPPEVR